MDNLVNLLLEGKYGKFADACFELEKPKRATKTLEVEEIIASVEQKKKKKKERQERTKLIKYVQNEEIKEKVMFITKKIEKFSPNKDVNSSFKDDYIKSLGG
jgi:hypothetical protein